VIHTPADSSVNWLAAEGRAARKLVLCCGDVQGRARDRTPELTGEVRVLAPDAIGASAASAATRSETV